MQAGLSRAIPVQGQRLERGSRGLARTRSAGLVVALLALVLGGAALAQYGYPYGYPYGNPYGYDPSAYMYGYPYGYDPSSYMYGNPYGYDPSAYMYGYDPSAYMFGAPMGYDMTGMYGMPMGYDMTGMYGMPGTTGMPGMGTDPMAQMDLIGQQLQAEMQRLEQQLAQFDEQAKAKMAEINQYFMNLYRQTTGDMTSSNEVALYYGQQIHCQQHPLDCQLAAQQASESAAALAANNAAFQARMASQQAAFDARNQQWSADMQARDQSNQEWIAPVIWGLDDYSAGAGSPTYQLPFAPSAGQTYQTPLGNPLVFAQSQNIWYQIGPDGTYTPYYQVP